MIETIIGLLGIGGITGAFFTYFWQKRKEIELKVNELKQKRYSCILILMYTYINKKEFKNLNLRRPEIRTFEDLKNELKTEWVNSWMFADDKIITSLKDFIDNPNEKTFADTVLYMRKDLWGSKTKLPLSTFSLEYK